MNLRLRHFTPKSRRGFGGISNLIMFPILVMIAASMFSVSINTKNNIIAQNNILQLNGTQQICFNSPNTNCSTSRVNPNTVITSCGFWNIQCKIYCDVYGQSSSQCQGALLAQSLSNTSPGIPTSFNGSSFSITQPISVLGVFNGIFSLGTGTGYVNILIIALVIVVIAGATVLGTGLNPASIYIAFMIIMYVAIWLFLTALSGDVFSTFPTITTSEGATLNVGSVLYSFLSLSYTLGVIQRIG